MDSALRFERSLGFSAESWMRMQMTVDMYDALTGVSENPSSGLSRSLARRRIGSDGPAAQDARGHHEVAANRE